MRNPAPAYENIVAGEPATLQTPHRKLRKQAENLLLHKQPYQHRSEPRHALT